MNETQIKIGSDLINYKYFENKNNDKNLIILHGWGGSSDSWEKVGELLSQTGLNVYIPDLPGFGKTQINKVFDAFSYAELVEEFIKKLNLEPIYLLGHSNGGRISIIIETNGNIKINKLFLIGSAGIKRKIGLKQKISYGIAKIFKPLKRFPGFNFIRNIFYKLIGGHDYLNCENDYIKNTFLNVLNTNLEEKIVKIKTQTELIWGDLDTYTPINDGKMMSNLINNSNLTILRGERHGIHLDSPEKLFLTIKNKI